MTDAKAIKVILGSSMRSILSFCLFLICAPICLISAQQPGVLELGVRRPLAISPVKPVTERNRRPPTHFRTDTNQNWQRIGFLGRNLEPQLETNALAVEHLKRYKSATWISTGFTVGATGSFIKSLSYVIPISTVFGAHPGNDYAYSENMLFWLGATGLLITGGIIAQRKATKHLKQAVSVYNDAIVAFPRSPVQQLYLRPVAIDPGIVGIGLGIAF